MRKRRFSCEEDSEARSKFFVDPLQGFSRGLDEVHERRAHERCAHRGGGEGLEEEAGMGVPFCGSKDPSEHMGFGRNLMSAAGVKESLQGFGRSKPSKG